MSILTHTPRTLAAYLRRGEDGLDELAGRLHEAAHDRPGGKFSKRRALYLPQSPFPPLLWRTQCERCRFWQAGAPGEPGRCHVVGREGDPFGGEAIHPRGWCGFWMPPAGEPAFAWIDERLDPDGASKVRGTYDADGKDAPGTSDSAGREPVPAGGEGDTREATVGPAEGGGDGE